MSVAQAQTIRTVTRDEALSTIDELLTFAAAGGDRRVVIERDGKPVAAIVSLRDLTWLDQRRERRKRAFDVLDRFSEAFTGVSDEELEREANKAVAEVRAEMRAERQRAATETS